MNRALRILFVEDMETDMLLILRALERGGYDIAHQRVETADALRRALSAQQWDAIISDYSLPQFSAPAARAIVAEQQLDLPFLIVSGTISEETAVTALRAGAHDFITKDRLARLIPALERELGEAQNRRARRAAEQERDESQQRFTRLAENAPDMIYRFQLNPWRGFDYVNPAASRITKYSQQEFYAGQQFEDVLIHPADRDHATKVEESLHSATEPIAVTIRWVRKDKVVIWTDHRIIPLRNEVGEVVAVEGIARDITESMHAEQALRQSEERYRSLVVTSPDAIILTDLNGIILFCNEQAIELYGGGHMEAILWKPALQFIAPEDQLRAEADFDRILRENRTETNEYMLIRPDQTRVPAEISTSIVRDAASSANGFVAVLRDISERKRVTAQIARQVSQLGALRSIDMAIMASSDLRVTLNVCLDQVTSQLGVDAAAVLILDSHTQMLHCSAWRGFQTNVVQRKRLHLGEDHGGWAALERQMMHIADLRVATDLIRVDLVHAERFVSYFGMPLVAKGHVKGVLEVFHRAPLEPDTEWLEFFESLAGQVAIAIDNAALFDGLQHSNMELGLAYDSTLAGWSRALDLRDKETEGHSERVTDLTLVLAQALQMAPAERAHVRRGALLHDIGKLGIPDRILLKPGKLDDEEWVIMRKHPVYAYEWLAPINYLRPALDIPYCHHEKWDGTGYPRGLKGEQIPIAARIFALVDVWDAMRSDRPYRAALPVSEVRHYISTQAMRHFDPQLVPVFLSLEQTQGNSTD